MNLKLSLRLAASVAALAALSCGSALAQDAATPAAPAPAASAPAPAPTSPPAPETPLAKVGDQTITQADLDTASQDLASQFGQLPSDQQRVAVLSALIDIKALAEEANAAKLGDDPAVARQLAFLRERALHNAYFEKNGLSAITDAELKTRYDAEVAAMKPVDEVHAQHILVPTKEEAEAVIKELDGGKDFAAVAAEKSKDSSGANGGDLGFFGPGQMVPPFEAAAFALEPGTYTKEPVQSQFGFHVIKVLEKRKQQPPAFEQVKDQVRQIVMREKYVAMVQKARESEGVEYLDPALKTQVEAMESMMAGGNSADPEAAADEAASDAETVPPGTETAPAPAN